MLEKPLNQAAGLLELAEPPAPKLMAVVSHGDEQSELPLLWRLCAALVDFGYAVTVLDGTTRESEANPGLEQYLENGYWTSDDKEDVPAWSIIPAGLGLRSLGSMADSQAQTLAYLHQLFQNEGIVLIYDSADCLVPLLYDTGISPLLVLTPLRSSLITSYRSLKHLLLNGRLEPTIVEMAHRQGALPPNKLGNVANSLTECAKNFLGYGLTALQIEAPFDDDRPCVDIQNLALRMLENTLQLSADCVSHPAQAGSLAHTSGQRVGSH
ncbi:MinD/ParA family protein [Rhodoferax aquaticus]|uniref:Cellulose synthase operon protein YhjQ n=1 Tax=Rhodoferax aquaticus TaxID=2527691 RepID=A0A515EU53_9BURK|nr:MinD/ParA family protein [Rhodoferax aquaticus]QDL56103.1 hypothetical protein EXZ61_19135 [Rhodoferax aquaticus]